MEDLTKKIWFLVLEGNWINKKHSHFKIKIMYDCVNEIHYLYGIKGMVEDGLIGTLTRKEFLEHFYKESL